MNNHVNATGSNHLRKILGFRQPTSTVVTNLAGHVSINARGGSDRIEVRQRDTRVTVTVNGRDRVDIDTRKAKSITIRGGSGDDRIRVDPSVTFPLILKGGSGHDRIDVLNQGHNRISEGEEVYGNFMRVLKGTICIPLSNPAEVPPPSPGTLRDHHALGPIAETSPSESPNPLTGLKIEDPLYQTHFGLPQGLNYELIPPEEIQHLWNQVVKESVNHQSLQMSRDRLSQEGAKTKKLELLLAAALKSGNIDMAVMLIAGLETRQANEIAGGLLKTMQALQNQRKSIAGELGKLGSDGKNAQKASSLNQQAADIGTEISLLQTFLQDVTAQKKDAQELASNMIRSQHETTRQIIRNIS